MGCLPSKRISRETTKDDNIDRKNSEIKFIKESLARLKLRHEKMLFKKLKKFQSDLNVILEVSIENDISFN